VPPPQLIVPVVEADAFGNVVFVVTVVVDVFVHPLFGSVTVTVYVPETPTVLFCVEEVNPPGPLQLYVAPEVEELPFTETVLVIQVKVPVVDELAFGWVVLVVTVVSATLVHPLPGSVTVKV
jgi:hypothetical protein